MEDKIRELLDKEIENQFESLSGLENGSAEKGKAVDDLVKLYKLRIEETKNEGELDEQQNRRFMEDNHTDDENEFRRAQLAEQVKDRRFRVGIAIGEIVLPLIFYASWLRKGFKFEENGTYTSTTFKGLFQKFRPTK